MNLLNDDNINLLHAYDDSVRQRYNKVTVLEHKVLRVFSESNMSVRCSKSRLSFNFRWRE